MNHLPHALRPWIVRTERTILRLGMMSVGFTMTIIGLALGVTMIMLPPGVVIALCGVALFIWGALGDLPVD